MPLKKPTVEWKDALDAERYHVLFEQGTEYPMSSPLNGEKGAGTYVCTACGNPLFDAAHKYNSGSGWPSFWQAIGPDAIATSADNKLATPRIEHHCARCGGHQGHIFEDGPLPSGLRFCNNGLSLEFIPAGTPLPKLRD